MEREEHGLVGECEGMEWWSEEWEKWGPNKRKRKKKEKNKDKTKGG